MSERFRITDQHGFDVVVEDSSSPTEIVLSVDPPDAGVASAYLDMAKAIAIRDALSAFIDGRFDAFVQETRGGSNP